MKEIKFCKKCLTPNSRPRVVFDQDGICNACHNADEKKKVDWDKRKTEFIDLVSYLKDITPNGYYHCIVPWSGGKDSSTVAYKLKFEYGLNPLLVTYAPMIPNEIGHHNRLELIKLGFDNLYLSPNYKTLRYLAQRFFKERGNPKVAWDAGINAVPLQVAVNYKIPAVFYAEHGESEYGGRVLSEEHKRTRDLTEVLENYVGDDPRNWADDEISDSDLNPYIYPDVKDVNNLKIKAYYFGYFFKWSMFENYLFIKEKINFKRNQKGRTDGTFTDFDSLDDKIDNLYYFMHFTKFGFGRAARDASRLIQNGHMSREEGLALALKYDDEFCYEHFDDILYYLQLTKGEFDSIVDQHRNPEIWKKEGTRWVLRTIIN